jgi:hypothetical protein
MRPIKSSILVALAFLIAAPLISVGAQEATGSLPLECGKRDLQIVAQLERENVNSQTFDQAFSTIMSGASGLLQGAPDRRSHRTPQPYQPRG